jgi:mRNA interferase RelE/StbE
MAAPLWRVEFDRAAVRDLRKLGAHAEGRVLRYLRERIASSEDPRRFGHALTGDRKGLWRYRIGDYRIVAAIEDGRSSFWWWRLGIAAKSTVDLARSGRMVLPLRIELRTSPLPRECSTTELRQQTAFYFGAANTCGKTRRSLP